MIRNVSARLAAGVVTALIGVMVLGATGATAANSRTVCFDSPDQPNANCGSSPSSTSPDSGVLDFTPVTTGGDTGVTIQIKNAGGQTLNHVKFAGGDVADNLPYNPLFDTPKPLQSFGGTNVAAGVTLVTVTDPATGAPAPAIFPAPASCTPSTLTGSFSTGFVCDVGTLAAKASATFTLVLSPPAAGPYHIWLTASWNEGWSTTGTNADYAFAEGDFTVVDPAPGCGLATANYFLPGQGVSVNDGGVTCLNQNGFTEHGRATTGPLGPNGGLGSLGLDSKGDTPPCPAAITNAKASCFGNTISVTLIGGVNVDWTITWNGIKSLSGVIHYKSSYTDGTDKSTYDTIPLTKKFQCPAVVPVPVAAPGCWVGIQTTNGNNPSITVEFITPTNGKGGGWI